MSNPSNLATMIGGSIGGSIGGGNNNAWNMSLRDFFAAQAIPNMQAFCSDNSGSYDPVIVAQECYALADALLAERASGARSTGSKPDEAPPNRAAGSVGRDDLEGAI